MSSYVGWSGKVMSLITRMIMVVASDQSNSLDKYKPIMFGKFKKKFGIFTFKMKKKIRKFFIQSVRFNDPIFHITLVRGQK